MKSLQRSLHALSYDPVQARLFARTAWHEIDALADWVVTTDPYGECVAIARALRTVADASSGSPDARAAGESSQPASVRAFIAHQLWCAWRQAAWTSGLATPLPLRVEGDAFVRETVGHPTIIVAPMTLSTADAMTVVQHFSASRPCVVFGEDVGETGSADEQFEVVSGQSSAGLRRIIHTLRRGGLFLTYPDFVYDGRSTETMPLFGRLRPVSSGFLTLAMRPGTMLLPLVCLRQGDAVTLRFQEPLCVEDDPASAGLGERSGESRGAARGRAVVAGAIGMLLESAIAVAPAQWQLLPTLTFDSPQMSTSTRAPAMLQASRSDYASAAATASVPAPATEPASATASV